MSVTLNEIAKAAGVSRATVDRALHDRGRIDTKKAERIKILAKEMGYTTNPHGRALVMSKHTISIGMIFQYSETSFMKMVIDGAMKAQADFAVTGVSVVIKKIVSHDEQKLLSYIDELISIGCGGIALTPTKSPAVFSKLREAIDIGIKIIAINSDIPEVSRLSYVGLDNYKAGQTCAGLMSTAIPGGGKVLLLSGHIDNSSQFNRSKGFCDALSSEYTNISLPESEYCMDDNNISYSLTCKNMELFPDIKGIYLPGGGQLGVCRALCELGINHNICVICYDLTQENVNELLKGNINFIIDQNAFMQGYHPVSLLKDSFFYSTNVEHTYNADVCIKTKHNL